VVLLALLAALVQAPRPALAATFVVNSLADTDDGACAAAPGTCTLREAINAANASPAPDTITFGLDGTIQPAAPLPALSGGGDTIDATSRARRLILSGQAMATASPPVSSHGLTITSSGNTVRGLVIVGFSFETAAAGGGAGIYLTGTAASANRIYDNWIGVGADGATAIANRYAGVLLDNGASNNEIGGTAAGQPNLIAGNGVANVIVQNLSTSANVSANNRIVGNRIGTNSAGTARVGDAPDANLQGGIVVDRWARGTQIRDNLIGGHTGNPVVAGVRLTSDALSASERDRLPRDTVIAGNRIGVTDAGAAIPNRIGILIAGGARYGALDTTIGDPADFAGGRNYIAGNGERGIEIEDSFVVTGDTLIVGNWIGLAPNGARVANGTAGATAGGEGIWVGVNGSDGATKATIGPGNVIAASRRTHIRLRSSGNVVAGNLIGTAPDGLSTSTTSFSNAATVGYGSGGLSVFVENGSGNRIGGPTAAERNVIASGGTAFGGTAAPILLDPRGASSSPGACLGDPCVVSATLIQGNYLGVKANGSEPLIASGAAVSDIEGIRIRNSAGNTVRANLIGGLGRGLLFDTGANNNVVEGNLIGTNASGSLAGGGVPNTQDGIRLVAGTGNRFENNVVAFNASLPNNSFPGELALHGIRVGTGTAGAADNNQFIGNRLVANGTSTAGAGIFIQNSQRVLVSRTTTERHGEAGIVLLNANNNIQAPTLAQPATTATTIGGTAACGQGCTVELFTGPSSMTDRNEGPVYLASATTGAGGSFTLPLAGCLGWATATVRDANGNTSPFSSPVDLTGNTTCRLPTITLSAASPNARSVTPGGTATYVHTVSHDSPIERTYNVVLSSSRGWASAPTTITVPANGSAQLSVTVAVPAGTPTGTADTTTVRVVLPGTSAQSAQQTDTTTAQVVTQSPAAPAVSPGQARPLAGGQVTFTHTVTNTGDLAGDFAVVGPTFVGTAPAGWSIASATLGQARLNGGQSTTLTIVVNTPQPLPAPGNVGVSFRVRVVGGAQTDPATVDTIVVPQARGLTFTGPTPASASAPVGGAASYVYTLRNTGNAADTFQVTVPSGTTPAAAGITFAASPAGSFQLAAGATRAVTVTASIGAGVVAGTYRFTAQAQAVGGTNPPPPAAVAAGEATLVVTGGGAPFFVGEPTVTPAEAAFGAPTDVTITWAVRNNGNTPAPFSFALEGALPDGWTQVGDIATTCPSPVPNTTAGSSCTVSLTVRVPAGLPAGPRSVSIRATADNSGAGSPNASAVGTASVVVETVRGVAISAGTPATSQEAPLPVAPGAVVSFTHTVTNTGNAPDSFTLTVDPGQAGWTATAEPATITNLPANGSATVTVRVTVPEGVPADTVNSVAVAARSQGDSTRVARTLNRLVIQGLNGADLSPGQVGSGLAGTTVSFTHTLTNTGSTTVAFRVEAESDRPEWPAPVVEPGGPIGPLAPGQAITLTVRVAIPEGVGGGTSNATTLRVFAEGTQDPVLDSEVDIVRAGAPLDVLIFPDRTATALPDSTVVLTHTVTNNGTNRDTYRLTVVEASGLPAQVGPDLVDLGPGESQTISVTLNLPLGLRAGSDAFARVTATSLTDPTVTGSAVDEITIAQRAGVDLSAAQERGVLSGGMIALRNLALRNIGNAPDTFTLSFEDVTGLPGGLGLEFNPGTITLDANEVLRGIAVRAVVPGDVPEGQRRRVRVIARSTFDPSVSDSVTVDIVYRAGAPNPGDVRLYLPLVAK